MIDKVFLWCGSGYQLTTIDLDFPVLDGETALKCAVIKALDNQYPIWWIDANDRQAVDIGEDERFIYLDLTMGSNHGCGYICIENMEFGYTD